ncbi:MAG: hypothetical protein P8047_13700 [Gammaproteobacteria bacterium]|jgi:WD40 repeat protein
MIFIATSNGVYVVDTEDDKIVGKLSIPHSLEIFGICWSDFLGKPIFVSRNRPWLFPFKKKSTSCNLYAVTNDHLLSFSLIGKVKNLHDVHQIATAGPFVYLTDTSRNRIVVYDIKKGRTISNIDIGSERKDINHVNALSIEKDCLLIGLNNRGHKEAQILKIKLDRLDYSKKAQRGDMIGEIIELPNREHTHDILPFNDDYLVSASHDGVVFNAVKNTDCVVGGGWVRGLASIGNTLWIGESKKAERNKRHSSELSGALNKYDSVTFEKLGSVSLPGAGQVNDLLFVDDEKLTGSYKLK